MARESNRSAEPVAGLEILRWAHGGEGVGIPSAGPLAGRVVFVGEVVPGDVVDVAVTEAKARWARARVIRVVRASAGRVPVPCAVQERCGGCPWMPGDAAAQAASRRAILEGELKKRLGLPAEHLELREAPQRYGYRQRLRLTFEAGPDPRLGFLGRKSHALVDAARCEVADERINARLPDVRARLAAAARPGERGRVTLLAGDEGVAGFIEWERGAAERFGPPRVTTRLGRFSQALAPEAFAQANAAVTGQMLDTLAAWARELRDGRADDPWAVELFAGAGTLTMALWDAGWRVAAYEVAEAAKAGFEATRAALGVAPERGSWHATDLAVGLPWPTPPAPALVVLDPPRTGAAEVMPWVKASGVAHVVYVSCDLATGLRDAAVLTAGGTYRVARVVAFDMFPHSGHQELMLFFARSV